MRIRTALARPSRVVNGLELTQVGPVAEPSRSLLPGRRQQLCMATVPASRAEQQQLCRRLWR